MPDFNFGSMFKTPGIFNGRVRHINKYTKKYTTKRKRDLYRKNRRISLRAKRKRK